jgi:hypothetical protein
VSDNETRTCPCGGTIRADHNGTPFWAIGWQWASVYCNQCGATLDADGTTGPTAADLAAAYERLLEAHAGTPAACGLDAATWADAARAEARPSC